MYWGEGQEEWSVGLWARRMSNAEPEKAEGCSAASPRGSAAGRFPALNCYRFQEKLWALPAEGQRDRAMSTDEYNQDPPQAHRFPATHWTDVVAARREGSSAAAEALNRLCTTYWYPIYAYIRRKGHSDADAKDIAQGFFYHILEKNLLGSADRTKGKFRSFLLGSLNYFLANLYEFEHAQKRGGGAVMVSLDDKIGEERYSLEPIDELSPEKLFERRWALDLHEQAILHLEADYRRQGKEQLFLHLKPFLVDQTDPGDYQNVARALNMSPGAVTTASSRLRSRYGEFIDAEIARTVASPEEIPAERRYICEVLCLANVSSSRSE